MLWEQHDAYRAAAIAFRLKPEATQRIGATAEAFRLKPEATLLERVASGFSRKDA
jgi:hypothetical protein